MNAARQFHWHEIRRRRKARAGKNSFPPTPFLFSRPSVQFRSCRASRGNQSGFCSKKVRAAFSNCDQLKKEFCRTLASEKFAPTTKRKIDKDLERNSKSFFFVLT